MSTSRATIRLKPVYRLYVAQAAAEGATAVRALLLLGAAAAGYDMAPAQDELFRLLGAGLDAPVRSALLAVSADCQTDGRQVSDRWQTPPKMEPPVQAEHDPLATIGFSV